MVPISDPIHVMRPSGPRRVVAMAILVALGGMLLWIALAQPPEGLFYRVFLLLLGAGALVLAAKGWSASAEPILLTDTALRTESGTIVAMLDNIRSVDRGTFAFKPSNGFILRLHAPLDRAWAPGMWWRIGRRVGVGGVTAGADAKIVADALAMMVAQRDR